MVSKLSELELLYSWLRLIMTKEIQFKIVNGKRHIGQGPRKIRCGVSTFHMPVLLRKQCLFLPLMMCDNKHRILPTLVSRIFIGE